MTIEELAERKTLLSQRLQGIAMTNISGKSNDDLVALNLDQIKTQKELFEVEGKIGDYIEGRAA